jgi:hypothetical protein
METLKKPVERLSIGTTGGTPMPRRGALRTPR